ncbi:hypothetical protein F2P79_024291 [Pimephales promelas]|nr:hypothetical protein F2P79_024291 [Pimephales promelas]
MLILGVSREPRRLLAPYSEVMGGLCVPTNARSLELQVGVVSEIHPVKISFLTGHYSGTKPTLGSILWGQGGPMGDPQHPEFGAPSGPGFRDTPALRATNPVVPLVSTLDLLPEIEDPDVPLNEDEEECSNPDCKERVEKLRLENSNLNQSVDTLTTALRDITRRYRLLKKRSASKGAGRLSKATRRLISSLGSGGDPSIPTLVLPPCPGHPVM